MHTVNEMSDIWDEVIRKAKERRMSTLTYLVNLPEDQFNKLLPLINSMPDKIREAS